jgi:hypothetical protein
VPDAAASGAASRVQAAAANSLLARDHRVDVRHLNQRTS